MSRHNSAISTLVQKESNVIQTSNVLPSVEKLKNRRVMSTVVTSADSFLPISSTNQPQISSSKHKRIIFLMIKLFIYFL